MLYRLEGRDVKEDQKRNGMVSKGKQTNKSEEEHGNPFSRIFKYNFQLASIRINLLFKGKNNKLILIEASWSHPTFACFFPGRNIQTLDRKTVESKTIN